MVLIDLDEIKKYPIRLNSYDKEHGDKNFVLGIESLMEFIEYLPTVDIVFCKDCKFYNTESCSMYDKNMKEQCGKCSEEDAFCYYGERKDDSSKD